MAFIVHKETDPVEQGNQDAEEFLGCSSGLLNSLCELFL